MPPLEKRKMSVWALKTSVHVWRADVFDWMDRELASQGVQLLSLPWEHFPLYVHDRDHFTWLGFTRFAVALARAVAALGVTTLRIYADSTIDFHNWSDGTWTGRANQLLRGRLAATGVEAYVDAVSGSGFVARESTREDFASRVEPGAPVLLIGGWNDAHSPRHAVARGIRDALAKIRRGDDEAGR